MIEVNGTTVQIAGQSIEQENTKNGTSASLNNFGEFQSRNVTFLRDGGGNLGLRKDCINIILNVPHTYSTTIGSEKRTIDCVGAVTLKPTIVNGVVTGYTIGEFMHVSIPALFRKELKYSHPEEANDTSHEEVGQKLSNEKGKAMTFDEFRTLVEGVSPFVVVKSQIVDAIHWLYDDTARVRLFMNKEGVRVGTHKVTMYKHTTDEQTLADVVKFLQVVPMNDLLAGFRAWCHI